MYYPEANALVPRRVDPASRTPAFKNIVVDVEPLAGDHPRAAAYGGGHRADGAAEHSTRDTMRAC
jgi:hypothetical protein